MSDEAKVWLQNGALLLFFVVVAAWSLNGMGDNGTATLMTGQWRWLRFIPLTLVAELLFCGLSWAAATTLWRKAATDRRFNAAYWGFMAANIVLTVGIIGLRARMMFSFVGYTLADVATVAAVGLVAALVTTCVYMIITKRKGRS